MAKLIHQRAYQDRAVKHFTKSKSKRLLMTGPTGSGKTVIAARIIAGALKRKQRVLVVVHRKELAVQMYDHLLRAGIKRGDLGIIMGSDEHSEGGAERVNPNARVQVCGVMTLIARDQRPKADLVVVDECHRVMADSYQELAEDYPRARHLGFTATPVRFDGIGLGDFYDELYIIETPPKLVEQGFLVEPKAYTVPEHKRPCLKGLRVSAGDYNTKQLEEVTNKVSFIGTIVDEIKRHAMNRQTVIFAVGKQHAAHILRRVKKAGFKAEKLLGDTPMGERDRILSDFEKKRIQIIVNCGVLTEGWDMPVCKCVVLARPTKSLALYLQMVGRIERPYGGMRPIILDHVGACLKRGLPTDYRDWQLTETHEGGTGDMPRKACPECNAVVAIGYFGECPECGYEFEAPKRELDETADRLVEMEALRERVEKFAKERGIKKAWVEKVLGAVA